MQVNVHEAKTHLSRLIHRAQLGEEIIIAKAGRPVIKLVPAEAPSKRVFGSAAGLVKFQKGWDAPLDERKLEEFLGEGSARHQRVPVVHHRTEVPAVAPGGRGA